MTFIFLSLDEVLYIHQSEMEHAGHIQGIRDEGLLRSAIENPRFTYENEYETDIFKLAALYIQSIALNHPFLDGNKRVAALAALIFLDYNGFEFNETYDTEFADKILDFVNKSTSKDDLAEYLKQNSRKLI